MNFEKTLILHCSPTLARIKSASLFTLRYASKHALDATICTWQEKLRPKGIEIHLLKAQHGLALVYLYRKQALLADLTQPEAAEILASYGYHPEDIAQGNLAGILAKLRSRLAEYDEFPHEIGLFLSYPVEDVRGFICHKGKNCNLCGYWKVYGDTDAALRKFAQYDKCNNLYHKLWQEGKDIMQLTVA